MENQNYSIRTKGRHGSIDVEFFVGEIFVDEVERREIALVLSDDLYREYDTGFDLDEIDSLIDFLTRARDYVQEFNSNSASDSLDFSNEMD